MIGAAFNTLFRDLIATLYSEFPDDERIKALNRFARTLTPDDMRPYGDMTTVLMQREQQILAKDPACFQNFTILGQDVGELLSGASPQFRDVVWSKLQAMTLVTEVERIVPSGVMGQITTLASGLASQLMTNSGGGGSLPDIQGLVSGAMSMLPQLLASPEIAASMSGLASGDMGAMPDIASMLMNLGQPAPALEAPAAPKARRSRSHKRG